MSDESAKKDFERLSDLDPDARSRVEAALKDALERETVTEAVSERAAAHIFSRGWIFSRLTPAVMDVDVIRSLPGIDRLSPDDFAQFATRLSELKSKTNPSGGGS